MPMLTGTVLRELVVHVDLHHVRLVVGHRVVLVADVDGGVRVRAAVHTLAEADAVQSR